jgi:oxygen-independent coproporphyrinogen-3 oxidase
MQPTVIDEPQAAPAARFAWTPSEPIGLYIHIPFCERKCPYCDFNTYAGLDDQFAPYVAALCRELGDWGARLGRPDVATLFLGGGTPTVLDAEQLERILATAHDSFRLLPDAELTCEANPGTVDRAKFAALRALGVNRLSMGVQSFQPEELAFLGRIHDVADVYAAFDAARSAGFDNLNLDFIFGVPGQTEASWSDTLSAALALAPEHLSLYSLIVEPNTPLFTWVETGRVAVPDDDAAATLYELAQDRLAAAGYVHYEVSNWARDSASRPSGAAVPAFASRHNLGYWRNGEYLGVGPGAHSHLRVADQPGVAGRRWSNVRPVPGYIRRASTGTSTEASGEDLPDATAMGETMLLGLRLVDEGVPYAHFQHLHGTDPRAVYPAELAELSDWGLLSLDEAGIRLTPRGLAVANQVTARFV